MSRKKLTPAQVESAIAFELEGLRTRAVAPPAAEPIDPDAIKEQERHQREERRADNLRRMRSPVLVQRQPDGSIVFKDDPQVREKPYDTSAKR